MESFTMWSPLSLHNDKSLPIIMVEGRLLPTVLGAALSTLCRMSFSILDSSSPSPNTIPAPFPSHSCVTHCPELDLSVSLSPAPNPDHMQQKTCRLKQSQHSDEPQQRPHPRRQTERKRNTKEMEFNSKKALQQTLLKSRRTKTLIDARAIEVVNVSPSQHLFNSLVSVSVQEDELLSQVLQAKLILAPLPSHYYKSAESPSLNFFITSELFRKKPLQQEEEPAKCKPSPVACPAYSTFDLYRRQRCWEAIP
ncbi:protein phosphatase 1 regulatory subunit 35-like isoform X5 [Xiphophorus maculatus]|uniref:protein phosphatase 1 regulatory subunit 35-like isoform X5 n=1 Tax=Xiphophorus maculatus TaxID=8083 RepID=UPI000C6D8F30|nr:protein phosphatase 1 regulatory subunit 35-like isoform X5 [Xiphophorus maculatus]